MRAACFVSLPFLVLGGEAPTGYAGHDEPYEAAIVQTRAAQGDALPHPDLLKHCHGDCDSDADCAHGFFCFQRTADEAVPGCMQLVTNPAVHGFDYCVLRADHPNAKPLANMQAPSPTTHAPHNNFFATKINDWEACTHIHCKVEDHNCTHETHENYQKDNLHDAPNYHGTHKLYPGAGKMYARPCAATRSLRVYHHSQEQRGLAHRCTVTADNDCYCECAHKTGADKWVMLGDEASALYAPTTTTCPGENALLDRQRCTSRQINGTPNNPLLATSDWAACKAECEKFGSGCVEFGQGVCRCFDKKVFQPPYLEPANGPQYEGIRSAVCTDNVQSPNRVKALEYYGKAAALGNKYAEMRIQHIHSSTPLFGHFSKQEYAACSEVDVNSIGADAKVALTARCQCKEGFWKVNAGHIFMTKCSPCPDRSHAVLSSVGTNTCACDAGLKLTAQGSDLECELPEHPADTVAKQDVSLDVRNDNTLASITPAPCKEIDFNSIDTNPKVALTARCQCKEGFWKVNAGHIFMTRCSRCPAHAHATLSSVGTNTCSCEAGYKLTAQGTELVCEQEDIEMDRVIHSEAPLPSRSDAHDEIDYALDEQVERNSWVSDALALARGGNED